MSEAFAEEPVGIGHNQPEGIRAPKDLPDYLTIQYSDLTARKNELLASVSAAPTVLTNDDEEKEYMDFIKQIKAAIKTARANRVAEKQPYLDGGSLVDGHFGAITSPLTDAGKKLNTELTRYQRDRALKERQEREAEERRLREIVRQAEERRREAEEKLRLAEEKAENERRERERREQQRRDEAAEAQRAKDAGAPMLLEPEPTPPTSAPLEEEELAGALASEVSAAADAAAMVSGDATKAAALAKGKLADMSRARSDRGSVASLRTRWVHGEESLDRNTIDLEALRFHIPEAALHQAVRSFIKAADTATLKTNPLRGVDIYEESQSIVR